MTRHLSKARRKKGGKGRRLQRNRDTSVKKERRE